MCNLKLFANVIDKLGQSLIPSQAGNGNAGNQQLYSTRGRIKNLRLKRSQGIYTTFTGKWEKSRFYEVAEFKDGKHSDSLQQESAKALKRGKKQKPGSGLRGIIRNTWRGNSNLILR